MGESINTSTCVIAYYTSCLQNMRRLVRNYHMQSIPIFGACKSFICRTLSAILLRFVSDACRRLHECLDLIQKLSEHIQCILNRLRLFHIDAYVQKQFNRRLGASAREELLITLHRRCSLL